MAKEKESDPMENVYNKVQWHATTYANDPYWQAMQAACESLKTGKTDQKTLDILEQQRKCCGPLMSNRVLIESISEKLKGCEVE